KLQFGLDAGDPYDVNVPGYPGRVVEKRGFPIPASPRTTTTPPRPPRTASTSSSSTVHSRRRSTNPGAKPTETHPSATGSTIATDDWKSAPFRPPTTMEPTDTTRLEGITAMAKINSTMFISAECVAEIDPDWHFPYFDENMGRAVGEDYDTADVLLIGRETYDSFAGAWPDREAAGGDDAPFARPLGACG